MGNRITKGQAYFGALWVGGNRVYGDGRPVWKNRRYVDPAAVTGSGKSWKTAYTTIQAAVNAAVAGDLLSIAPGEYDEVVTLAAADVKIGMEAVGGPGSVYIKPSAADSIALTNNGSDNYFINIGMEGNGTGGGFLNSGLRCRTFGGKYEGGAFGAKIRPNDTLSIDASDLIMFDPEFCWADSGLILTGSVSQNLTQPRIIGGRFHNNADAHISDGVGADAWVVDAHIDEARFLRNEDGATPTVFVDLNKANDNGQLVSCRYSVTAAGLAALLTLAAGVLNVDARTAA